MTRLVALVPMRDHSQRVPGKNYRVLAGKPLYYHVIETLLAVPEVNDIVVDTDSKTVQDGLRQNFSTVKIVDRPEHLRADDIPMNEILLYDTGRIAADYFLQTHSTNPLLKSTTVSRAIESLISIYPAYDSLFSVTRLQARLYDQSGRAINHNPSELVQTQDLPPLYEENSCLYIFTREGLIKHHHRIGQRPMLFEVPADEAWDIDDELDFAVCDFLIQRSTHS